MATLNYACEALSLCPVGFPKALNTPQGRKLGLSVEFLAEWIEKSARVFHEVGPTRRGAGKATTNVDYDSPPLCAFIAGAGSGG